MNTFQLYNQDEVWRTSDGMLIKLEEMSVDHRRHTLAFLARNAPFSRRAYDWCELALMVELMNMLPEDGPDEIECSDIDWLNGTPLVRRLAKMVLEDSAVIIDGEVVAERNERMLARRRAAIQAVAVQHRAIES